MNRPVVLVALLTACSSDYKVHANADALAGGDDFFDTGITEAEDDGEEIDPDAPVAICDVTPDKVRPITQSASWLGADSYDPNDEELTDYSWTLVDRPVGSAAIMPSGGNADRSGFETDLAGDYVGQLIVTNESGVKSPPCEVTLTAEPVEALWVEMFWESANDDMDLHLLAPGGTLETDTDCYYANCTPSSWSGGLDWGIPGDSTDDPTLDLDDITLTGPENVNIEMPEDDSYTVIVHDHTSQTFTAGNAVTINIYLDGSLQWSDTRVIVGEDTYTEFARINVDDGTIDTL